MRKKLKAIRGNGYRFVRKGGAVPTENHHACCEKLRLVRNIYPNLPQMGKKVHHGMLMPLHDSMPIFMNFRRVLDLLEFKNQVSQSFRPSHDAQMFEFHSYLLHGTYKFTQGHTCDFSNNFGALEHVLVVQI